MSKITDNYYCKLSGRPELDGGSGGATVSTLSPVQGNGSGGSPITLISATNTGQYLVWDAVLGAWVIGSSIGDPTNTNLGTDALASRSGTQITAIGVGALSTNTGLDNTAIGFAALAQNISGNSNIALGSNTLLSNVTGNFNIAIGVEAVSVSNADDLIGIGYQALKTATISTNNIAIGNQTMMNDSNATDNVIIGNYADISSTQTVNCVAIGQGQPGGADCQRCVNIGYGASNTNPITTDSVCIGSNSTMTVSNGLCIGAFSVCSNNRSLALGRSQGTNLDDQLSISPNGLSNGALPPPVTPVIVAMPALYSGNVLQVLLNGIQYRIPLLNN